MPVQLKKEEIPTPYTSVIPPVQSTQNTAPVAVGKVASAPVVTAPLRRAKKFFVSRIWALLLRRGKSSVVALFIAVNAALAWLLVGVLITAQGSAPLPVVTPTATTGALTIPVPIIAAIITLLGQGTIAFFAWKQFQKNYEQKNREIKDRDDQFKKAEDNKAEQFDKAEANKLAQFRSKELQDQFGDIQNRLADESPVVAAYAAHRLAKFGKTMTDESKPKTAENCPNFIDAVGQLATALYLEPNPAIRKAIREAFKNLIAFANTNGDDQPLLHALIERLADANRTAKDGFIKAFAEWVATRDEWKDMEHLHYKDMEHLHYVDGQGINRADGGEFFAIKISFYNLLYSLSQFDSREEVNENILKSLTNSLKPFGLLDAEQERSPFDRYRDESEARQKIMNGEEKAKFAIDTFSNIQSTAQQLIDTRDALAEALLALNEAYLTATDDAPVLRKFHLRLNDCFLAGADLFKVNLQGAFLGGSYLQGASFWFAKLQNAHLYNTMSQFTDFSRADLTNADFSLAHLEGAHLTKCKMKGTKLYGIYFSTKDTTDSQPTTFSQDFIYNTLESADFTSVGKTSDEANDRTNALKTLLEMQHNQEHIHDFEENC